jgi:hypothetical protein
MPYWEAAPMRAKNLHPCLEALEDRLTPALTYVLDAAGNLTVTGTTVNPTLTITEAAGNSVTIMDGASSNTFAVPGNLNVNVTSLNAVYLVTYNVGGTVLGNVSLSARSLGLVDVSVNGTGGSIHGNLTLKTGGGDDLVGVNAFGAGSPLTVAGSLSVDTGAGNDFLVLGGIGDVTVGGNLFAYNVNTLLFGASTETVGGFTHITTDTNTSGGANLVSTSATTTMAGDLFFTGTNASTNDVVLNGTVGGRLFASLGNGAADSLVAAATSVVGGSAFIQGGNGGDSVTLLGSVFGNLSLILGNGGNTVIVGGTVGGTSISYLGGSGGDTFTYAASAPAARLTGIFGAGDDTFNLDSNSLASAYLNGGAGTNTFNPSVTINFPITLVNF